jgi:hypothetical protein
MNGRSLNRNAGIAARDAQHQQGRLVERQPAREIALLFIVPLVAIGLRLASEQTANLSYLVLAGYALFGRAQAIQALALGWLITMVNPGLAPDASLSAAGRYLVVLAAAGSVLARSGFLSRPKLKPFTVLTLGLGGFILVHSILVSPFHDVSLLKAFSWMLVVMTLVAAWSGLNPVERYRLSEQVFWGLVLVLAVSLPLLATPVGYLTNGRGFQGILNQPQAFGPTMALLGAWAAGRFLGEKRPPWSLIGLAMLCLVLVVLSEARTAGVAMVLGIGIGATVIPLLANRRPGAVLPGLRSKRFQITGVLVLMGVVAAGPTLNDVVADFISKSGQADVGGLFEAYERSRGFMIEGMTENIRQDPWVGIGFGIASEPFSMRITRDPVFGLPVSAAVEKGVMPLAVLEEIGIPGFILVGLWIWVVLRRSARGGLAPLTVVITVLLINMGESVLFSPGGLGMLQLILIAWAIGIGLGEDRTRRGLP